MEHEDRRRQPLRLIGLSLLVALTAAYVATRSLPNFIRLLAIVGAGLGACVTLALALRPEGRDAITGYLESQERRLDEEHDVSRRKAFEFAALFCILIPTYELYLQGILTGPREIDMGRVGRFCLISGVPFMVIAFADAAWRSRDAAPTAFLAWAVVFLYYSEKYGGGCPPTAAFYFTPLVFSALTAHLIGTVRHGIDLSS